MKEKLKILILEDNDADKELIIRELQKAKFDFDHIITETEQEFLDALSTFKPHVILSDYALPQYDGMQALEEVKKHAPNTPFIIVTGSLNEETAVECIKRGAWDYVIKQHLAQLIPAVKNVLELREERIKKQQQDREFREILELNRAIIDNSRDCIKVLDLDENLLFMSNGGQRLLEIKDVHKYLHKNWIEFWEGEDRKKAQEAVNKAKKGEVGYFEGYCPSEKGTPKWWGVLISPIYNDKGKVEKLLSVSRDITIRKQIDQRLKDRTQRLQEAEEIGKLGHVDWDVKKEQAFWTEEVFKIYERSPELGPPSYHEIMALHIPEDAKRLEEVVVKALKDGTPYSLDLEANLPSGKHKSLHIIGKPIQDERGKVIHIKGIVQDITVWKKAEAELEKSEKLFRTLYTDSQSPIFMVEEKTRCYIDANQAALDFLECSIDELVGKSVYDFCVPDMLKKTEQEHKVFTKSKILETYYQVNDKIKILSLEITPLKMDDKTILVGIGQDITERKQAEEKFETYVTSSPTPFFIVNSTGDYTYVNNAASVLLGYTKNELLSMNIKDVSHPDDFEKNLQSFPKLLEGKKVSQEISMLHKSGKKVYAILDAVMLDEDNIIAFCTDTTERKESEQKIKENEEKYRALFDQSYEGIFLHDLEGNLIEVNDRACQQLDYTREELLQKNVFDIQSKAKDSINLPQKEVLSMWKQWKPDERHSLEAEHETKDGRVIPVQISTGVIHYGDRNLMLAVVQDISERKEYERKISESEEKYRTLVENINEGIWKIDAEGYTTFANSKLADMLGYSVEEMMGRHLFDFMDDEWVAIAKEKLKSRKTGASEEHEFVFTKKDGTPVYMYLHTSPLFDTQGNYLGAQAALFDITEKKAAEEQLKQSEEKYRSVVNNMTEGIFVLKGMKCVYANPAIEHISGMTEQEIKEKTILDIVYKEDKKIILENYEKRLKGATIPPYDFRIQKPNGEVRWLTINGRRITMARRTSSTLFCD